MSSRELCCRTCKGLGRQVMDASTASIEEWNETITLKEHLRGDERMNTQGT
jgi:hypothetical protein